jgi:hypothetical protein
VVAFAAAGPRLSNLPDAPRKPQPDRSAKADWVRVVRESGPYLGIGTTLAITVGLGVLVGYWVDGRLRTGPVFTLVGSITGVALAMYGFFRTVMARRR